MNALRINPFEITPNKSDIYEILIIYHINITRRVHKRFLTLL